MNKVPTEVQVAYHDALECHLGFVSYSDNEKAVLKSGSFNACNAWAEGHALKLGVPFNKMATNPTGARVDFG